MRRYRSCGTPSVQDNCVGLTQKDVPTTPCTPVEPSPIYTNAIGKAPVLVSMMEMKAMVTNLIEMPEGAVLPTVLDRSIVDMKMTVMPEADMLFVKGLVRTSMAYTLPDCADDDSLTGNMMHMTMDCPFEYTTEIDYNMCKPQELEPKFTVGADMKSPCCPCHDNFRDPGYYMTLDKLNTPMVPELLDAKIVATMKEDPSLYAAIGPCAPQLTNGLDDDGCTLREDMVIEMRIAIYQDQFVKLG